MAGQLFEWDAGKEAANLRNHGVAFEEIDDREVYGEERINLLGMCGDIMLHVTYTEREGRIRIISARRAEKYEREDYHRENSF